ncbi:uncharacterized protein LOC117124022 [Anneissia japonica]|uniref:uncharacterized protein LOC117124022 n=1 Tax=Anneissia japonica TaxID=1529436 RepID=UPI0014254F81|nr:uncharacterized protein LOC117124022 [Anneissia japonica]
MHPHLLVGLLFGDLLFIFSHVSSVIVKPTGYQYVKSNLQIMCTDDFRKAVQPQWISPSGRVIGEFKPQRDSTICDDGEHCMDEMGEYCDNAFASCVAGRCVCQKFGIDPCTCLDIHN